MPGHGPDCAAPLEPARADAGWSTTAPVSSPLDGGTYDRVVPALSSAVHSMGEIDHAVPGIPSLQLLTSALEGGSGIGSIQNGQNHGARRIVTTPAMRLSGTPKRM